MLRELENGGDTTGIPFFMDRSVELSRDHTLKLLVGKVYNRVLWDQLMKFAERKGGV